MKLSAAVKKERAGRVVRAKRALALASINLHGAKTELQAVRAVRAMRKARRCIKSGGSVTR